MDADHLNGVVLSRAKQGMMSKQDTHVRVFMLLVSCGTLPKELGKNASKDFI